MDQHITFTKSACRYCKEGITLDSTGFCPIPTCGLAVHIFGMGTASGFQASITAECGQERAAEVVTTIVKAAARTVADRQLATRLATRTEDEVAADEATQVEFGVSEEDYKIRISSDGIAWTSAEVAVEVKELLHRFEVEYFFDTALETLTK